jgi:hypothetical protein
MQVGGRGQILPEVGYPQGVPIPRKVFHRKEIGLYPSCKVSFLNGLGPKY